MQQGVNKIICKHCFEVTNAFFKCEFCKKVMCEKHAYEHACEMIYKLDDDDIPF